MSEQHEEEILRRWAREQAEIERQTDSLVLKALTSMVTAAEDLKSKLRRDIEGILEEYRRTKRGLENEISLGTAERQRYRREAEQEREAIVSDAQAKAREIVTNAERERESLLTEVRGMEQRLRTLEEQIRSVFGIEVATPSPEAASVEPDEEPQDAPAAPGGFVAASPTALTSRTSPLAAVGPRPAAETGNDVAAASAAPTRFQPTRPPVVSAPIEDDDEDEGPDVAVASPPPTPIVGARPAQTPESAPHTAGPRRVELIFDGVPGYQQASALEMAVGDLLPDGDVDIVEFERGQLVLSAQASDLADVAEQLVTSMPASLQLTAVAGGPGDLPLRVVRTPIIPVSVQVQGPTEAVDPEPMLAALKQT